MASTLLRVEKIGLTLGRQRLLNNIQFSINEKEIITLIGPNGAGKSCLLQVILGLRKPTAGKIVYAPSLSIGYMPQKLDINPLMPITVKRFLSLSGMDSTSVRNALSRVNVLRLLNASMHHLSGGEKQRVLLARAIIRQPKLLVMDEPAQALDVNGQNHFYQLIDVLRKEFACAVLMVSHDLHFVMAATDQVICLNKHVCCHGHPESVAKHPAYLELFGYGASNLATYTHHHDHHHNLHGEVVQDSNSEDFEQHVISIKQDGV